MVDLEIQGLCLSFGGLMALKEVDLAVQENEIRGIIGPNGAGKTTLLNVIARIYPPDQGKIYFRGKDLLAIKPHDVIREGISRIFQNSELFYRMTVLENVLLGFHTRIDSSLMAAALNLRRNAKEEKRAEERALETLRFVGMENLKDRKASELSGGQKRLVELARGLVSKPRLILLDEPAAGLSPENVGALVSVIKRLQYEMKMTVILVEHVIKLVMGISDQVTVLNDGEVIAEGSADGVRENPEVIEAYLGAKKNVVAT